MLKFSLPGQKSGRRKATWKSGESSILASKGRLASTEKSRDFVGVYSPLEMNTILTTEKANE